MLLYQLTTGGDGREAYSVHFSTILLVESDDQEKVREAFEELLGISRRFETAPNQGMSMAIDSDVITDQQLDLAMDHKSLVRQLSERGLPARIVSPDLVVLI